MAGPCSQRPSAPKFPNALQGAGAGILFADLSTHRFLIAMYPASLLLLYCSLIFFASLSGGMVPQLVTLNHRRLQISISFVAGVILGVGLLHLLPHAASTLGSIDTTSRWCLLGFLAMFFLERFFHFHHHDAPDDEFPHSAPEGSHGPGCHQPHGHGERDSCSAGTGATPSSSHLGLSWVGALVGLALHSLIDGVALGAAVAAETRAGIVPVSAGLGTFLAILLHKPFDSLSIGTLMAASGRPLLSRHWVNGLFALAVPCGAILFLLGSGQFDSFQAGYLGRALAFAAGTFICIATSDLLPELQFHTHDRAKLSVALLLGIGLAWTIVAIEANSRFGHQHGPASAPAQANL